MNTTNQAVINRTFTFAGYKNPGTRKLVVLRVDKNDGDGFIAHPVEDVPDASGYWPRVFGFPHGDFGDGDIIWQTQS